MAFFTPQPNLFCGGSDAEIFVIPSTHPINPTLEQVNLAIKVSWTGGGTQSADASVFIHHGGPFGFPLPEGEPGDFVIFPELTDPVLNLECTSELAVSPVDAEIDPAALQEKIAGLVGTGAISQEQADEIQGLIENGQHVPETNDGLDDDCDGSIDEIDHAVFLSKSEFSWPEQPGAAMYEVARSNDPQFIGDCFTMPSPVPLFLDFELPFPGQVLHYLARAQAPFVGSWGQDSSGAERDIFCP